MAIRVTQQAQTVIEQLGLLKFTLMVVQGDNQHFNQRLTKQHEERKREAIARMESMVAPHLAPGQRLEDVVEHTGEDGATENQPYTENLERTLGELGICRAVDIYHCYLRRVLQLALEREPKRIRKWAEAFKKGTQGSPISEKAVKLVESGTHPPEIIHTLFRGREGVWRQLVHEHLKVWPASEAAMFVTVRNCLVHELGEDRDGSVAKAAMGDSRWKPVLESGRLLIKTQDGMEAAKTFLSDISIMDQKLAHLYSLPKVPHKKLSFRRVYQ